MTMLDDIRRWSWQRAPLLGARCASRDNNFNLLRGAAATLVIFAHSVDLGMRPGPEWAVPIVYNRIAGNYAVQLFLVISGFLVSKSFFERRELLPFLAARALRIYPALACAVLLAVVLAAASSTLSWVEFLRHPDTVRYVTHNVFAFDIVHKLPGAYGSSYLPGLANAPLWTLPIELNCYTLLAALGMLGLLRWPPWFALALAGLALWLSAAPQHFPAWVDIPGQFAAAFALGSLAFAYRNRVRLSLPLVCALLAVNVILWHTPVAPWLFTFTLVYGVLVVAYSPPLYFAAYNRLGDYSYGLYVYAFPLQQTIVCTWPLLHPLPVFFLSVAATLPLAVLSWHFMEHPALRLKWRVKSVSMEPA